MTSRSSGLSFQSEMVLLEFTVCQRSRLERWWNSLQVSREWPLTLKPTTSESLSSETIGNLLLPSNRVKLEKFKRVISSREPEPSSMCQSAMNFLEESLIPSVSPLMTRVQSMLKKTEELNSRLQALFPESLSTNLCRLVSRLLIHLYALFAIYIII